MYFEILLVGILLFIILSANGFINPNKFIQDNQDIFMKLKESDYDFLVKAKYGDGLIKEYSKKLTLELGKGYSTRSLKKMRKFFLYIQ